MTFVRWDPFRDFANLDRGLNAVLKAGSRAVGAEQSNASWTPAVEIFENGTDLVIRAELPGISRDEVEINIENNTLSLSGERKQDVETEERKSYRSERTYGAFLRRFNLPATVDGGRVSATHKDGVLEIVLPKQEQAKPKRIEIAAA
jgi:HSP20 family protein